MPRGARGTDAWDAKKEHNIVMVMDHYKILQDFGGTPGVYLSVAGVTIPAYICMALYCKEVIRFDTDKVQAYLKGKEAARGATVGTKAPSKISDVWGYHLRRKVQSGSGDWLHGQVHGE